MRKRFRKITAVLLAIVIIVSAIPCGIISVSARTTESPNYYTAVTSYNDLLSRLESLKNKYVGTYWTTNGYASNSAGDTSKYYYGIQCNGFAKYIFNDLFCNGSIGTYDSNKYYFPNPNGAYLIDKSWNYSSSDTSTVKNILKRGCIGDIIQVRRRGKDYGHTMIISGLDDTGIWIFDCNSDGKCGVKNYYQTWVTFASKNVGMSLYHANNYPKPVKRWYDNLSPVDLGTNFYANIINTASWLHATNDNGNVNVNKENYNCNQVWHFTRLSNGSYKIISLKDNNCIEVHNFESTNGTNVEMHSYNDNSAQHWFVYGESGQYVFRAECGNNVLDLNGGAAGACNGTNLQMWENNGTDAQKFQIWKLDFPSLGTPNVKVSNYGGTNGDNIKLTWNSCENATGYDIRIYDESGKNNLYMYYNVQGTTFTTKIPSGNYIAEVTALNSRFNTWRFGTRTSFSCANNLGTDFYAYIINTA